MARRLPSLVGPALTLSLAAACAAGCGTAVSRGPAARASSAGEGGAASTRSASGAAALRGAPMISARCLDGAGHATPAGAAAPERSVQPFSHGAVPSDGATPEPLRTHAAAPAPAPTGAQPAVTPIAVSQGTLRRAGSGDLGGVAGRIRVAWCEPTAGRCPPGYWPVYRKTLPGSKPRSLIPDIAVCSRTAPVDGTGTGRAGG